MRFIKLSDAVERTYDSCLPDPFELFHINPTVRNGSEYGLPELVIDDATEESSWLRTQFPFKDDPDRLSEMVQFELFDDTYGGGEVIAAYGAGLTNAIDYLFRTGWVVKKLYTYAHRKEYNSLNTQRPLNDGRAYRYGVSSTLPEFSSTRWRTDHYGHFRDMLEPRQHAATFDGVKPVKIRFVSGSTIVNDPTDTHTQNLSTFATSSMPFFDDSIARNRDDNPDETLLSI